MPDGRYTRDGWRRLVVLKTTLGLASLRGQPLEVKEKVCSVCGGKFIPRKGPGHSSRTICYSSSCEEVRYQNALQARKQWDRARSIIKKELGGTMKIHVVEKAKKPYKCGGCGKEIEKGEPYKWARPFRGSKMLRCSDCMFRRSELTTSDKMFRVFSAVEVMGAVLAPLDSTVQYTSVLDDIRAQTEVVVAEINDVADEYDEAAQSWEGKGSAAEWEARAGHLREFADKLVSVVGSLTGPDPCLVEPSPDTEKLKVWYQDVVDRVNSTLEMLDL